MGYRILFIIIFLTSGSLFFSCQKPFTLNPPDPAVPTSSGGGSIKDSTGNCLPISVYGTFFNGIIPGDTNYVQMEVNVSTTGSYSIQSDPQNGFQFSGSGSFTNTGANIITLKATGIPTAIATTYFSISFGGSTCTFSVIVHDSTGHTVNTGGGGGSVDSTGPIANNTWRFTANGHLFTGPVIAAEIISHVGTQLTVTGYVPSGTDTIFDLTAQSLETTFTTGVYMTSATGTNFSLSELPSGNIIFAANSITSPPVLNINITEYNTSTNSVAGTFSGDSYDFNSNTIAITNGAFMATLK